MWRGGEIANHQNYAPNLLNEMRYIPNCKSSRYCVLSNQINSYLGRSDGDGGMQRCCR